ncbi:hypothetical protein [Georgenia faecalis]|uniref:hypothetical protein n=1 Tax=Georgenia faecalis TaxID=2483799 RepID=UPI000FD84FDF|nr:hypothetical protein [Georgenia faecalis]
MTADGGDDDVLALLDRVLAEPRHLLVLADDVDPAEVEVLAASHFDDAGWLGPAVLRLTGAAELTGPWGLDGALRQAFDLPAWAACAFLVHCPVERSGAVPPELLGRGGLLDAFPEGAPAGLEARVLEHLLAQARRLGGALRVAGTGAVLVPDPASAVDLTLYSPVWLEPEACVSVLAGPLPQVRPAWDDEPREPLPPRLEVDGPRAVAVAGMDPGEREWLHAEADAFDAAALARDAVLEGYAAVADLGADGLVEVSVVGEPQAPGILRALPWARHGVIAYELRWRPVDPEAALGPRPPIGQRRARGRVGALIGRAAMALHGVAGGEIVDDDGFLVDVEGLRAP